MTLETLYRISEVQESGTTFSASITFNPEHIVFNGHFPGQPVVPGVILIRILKDIVARIAGNSLILDHSGNIKFLNVIDPRDGGVISYRGDIISTEMGLLVVNATLSNKDKVCFKFKGSFLKA